MEPLSPKRLCIENDSEMIPKPEHTMPLGGFDEVQRMDSKTSNAINISVSSTAPPGLGSVPVTDDVNILKSQVEFLYKTQKECMITLNQITNDQREAVLRTNDMVSTLNLTLSAVQTNQSTLTASEKSLWGSINETRQALEKSAGQLHKNTAEIQEEAARTKQEFTEMWNRTTSNIQEETVRTRQDLNNMGKMFSDQMNAIVNHLDRVPGEDIKEEERADDPHGQNDRQSLRSSDGIRDWWYQLPENWAWSPNAKEPLGPTKFPTIHNRNVPANPTINLTISDPPKFDINRFESYRRDLLWWRDINSAVDDSTLITTIAVKCTEEILKSIVSNFLEETRDDRANRTFGNFIRILDSHFEKTAQELALGKMSLWTNFERKGGESIRNYWMRYNRVTASLAKSGIKMPDEILFSKALSSLKLEKVQLGILMSTLESKGITKDMLELQRISVKLFESQFLHATDAILKLEEEDQPEIIDELIGEPVEGEEDDEILECFSNPEGEVFEIRKVAPKSKRSKGLRTNAVNSSRNFYAGSNGNTSVSVKSTNGNGNKKSGSTLRCWRCNGNHSWRQCHLPWQKTLAFGTNIGNGSGNSSTKQPELAALTTGVQNTTEGSSTLPHPSGETSKGQTCENKTESIRLTEEEWISKYNLSVGSINVVTQYEEISEVHNNADGKSVFMDKQQIVLDSGATSSVVGRQWLHDFRGSNPISSLLFSKKRFKFGDSRVFESLGVTRIHIIVEVIDANKKKIDRHFTILCDVVPCAVPLLLSRVAMKNMRCSLDFEQNCLRFSDNSMIQLELAHNGHLILPMRRDNLSSSHHLNVVLASEEIKIDAPEGTSSTRVTKDDIRKLHLHLAHGSMPTLLRILQLSKRQFEKSDLETVLRECPCRESFHKLQSPIVSCYVPPYPAHTICLDIFFLPEAAISTIPHLIVVCALTRFIIVCRLKNIRPETVMEAVVEHWIMYFGRMVQIITDRGPGLIGRCWQEFADSWSCQISFAPKGSAHSNGIAERQIDLVKNGYTKAREMGRDTKYELVLRKVVLAKNLSPNSSTGICPMTSMIGRADILAPLETADNMDGLNAESGTSTNAFRSTQKHLLQLIELRNFMCMHDASRIIELCRNRTLRSGSKVVYKMGDLVEAFNPDSKTWTPNFTVVGIKESHLIIEKGKSIHRHPTCWVRLMHIPHSVTLPTIDPLPNNNDNDTTPTINEEQNDGNITCDEDPSISSHVAAPSDQINVACPYGEFDSNLTQIFMTECSIFKATDQCCQNIKPSCAQMLNWNWINDILWSTGLFLGDSNVEPNTVFDSDSLQTALTAVNAEDTRAISLEEENHLLSLTNPSRISPKIFLQIPGAVASICDEINNLLLPDTNKIPGLVVVDYKQEEYRRLPRIHATMVVKRKSTLKFKARLCARGDMLSSDAPLIYSSPTVSRVSPRMILSIAITLSLDIGIVDITSAFIQSNMVEKSSRLIIIPPYYVPLPWTNKIDASLPRVRTSSLAFLTIRPLYGTTDAPIRWFITFSTRFKLCGWKQMESDPCIFRLCEGSHLHGICSLHVDDVLMAGDQTGWKSFTQVISAFRHSGIQKLTP